MSKIDLSSVLVRQRTGYPKRFHKVGGDILLRRWQELGDAAGLTQFGVNRVVLPPGAASSLRHWHTDEDEFILMLEGELVLVTDEGETRMRAGDMAGFAKGRENGHHFLNRSAKDAVLIAIGTRSATDVCFYSDVDMKVDSRDNRYVTRAGVPYEDIP
jgi:uncharacterized cupin superfamily protein